MRIFKQINLNNSSCKGFTLIEMVVAIFGFSVVMWGMVGLLSNIFLSSGQQTGLLVDADYARKLVFKIAHEIRNGQTGSNGGYVLNTAENQQIIFYSNADTDGAVERIRYFVQSDALYKGVTEYNGSTYNTSTEVTTLVQKGLGNGASPIFSYYDGNFVGSSTQAALVQPVNVTGVKFIRISLNILNKAGNKGTNSYTVTSSAAVRNLKTNLGN